MSSYYEKNREKVLAKNKEYYHARKNDPEYYKKVLKRNSDYYYSKNKHPSELTDEEKQRDEQQMIDIMRWCRYVAKKDETPLIIKSSETVGDAWSDYETHLRLLNLSKS